MTLLNQPATPVHSIECIWSAVKYLLNFWNKNDDEYDENDACEKTETPFTQIVTDDGLRKVSNGFADIF